MSRWLVTSVPALALLVGLVIVVVGGAVLIQREVRRRCPALNGEDHNDVTKFTYGFIGLVYAFFIGFVVSAMWGQVNTADGNARAEGASAVQMARDISLFDKVDGDRIRDDLLAYENASIAEWPQAGTARSAEADNALAALYTAYRQVQAPDEPQKTALATSMANLDKISEARTVRLLTAHDDTGPPWPIWVVILLTSAMVLATVIIYGVEKPVLHYSMVVVAGVVVAANLFLLLELSHPYVGAVSTDSDPLQEVVRVLSQGS